MKQAKLSLGYAQTVQNNRKRVCRSVILAMMALSVRMVESKQSARPSTTVMETQPTRLVSSVKTAFTVKRVKEDTKRHRTVQRASMLSSVRLAVS